MIVFNKNKKGITLIDVGIATLLLTILGSIFYGVLSLYYSSIIRSEESTYVNFALTECAEVVHSFRYGEIDRAGSGGWQNFQLRYPTGLYKLEFNEDSKNWSASPIWKNPETEFPFTGLKEMLDTEGYTDATEGEKFIVSSKNNLITRYVYINNDNPEKSFITCSAQMENYMFKKEFLSDGDEFRNYHRLNFIMTDF